MGRNIPHEVAAPRHHEVAGEYQVILIYHYSQHRAGLRFSSDALDRGTDDASWRPQCHNRRQPRRRSRLHPFRCPCRSRYHSPPHVLGLRAGIPPVVPLSLRPRRRQPLRRLRAVRRYYSADCMGR